MQDALTFPFTFILPRGVPRGLFCIQERVTQRGPGWERHEDGRGNGCRSEILLGIVSTEILFILLIYSASTV